MNASDISARIFALFTGDLSPDATKERADFIRAVTFGLEYLEAGSKFSFDDAAMRLGLERGEVSS